MQARVRKSPPRAPEGPIPPVHPGGRISHRVVPAEVYAQARGAWLAFGTIVAIQDATGLPAERAQRLVDAGEPSLDLPSLRDAARAVAADLERKVRAKESASTTEQASALAATLEQRAKATARARTHEAKVLGDAVESRVDEVRLVRANRTSALVLARVNADLLKLSVRVARSLLDDERRILTLEPGKRLGLLRTVAGIVQRTAQASAQSVNMERLLMGEPTQILGRADGNPSTSDMTVAEAEEWLALANRAFARRAARRTVVEAEADPNPSRDDDATDELLEDLA